MTSARQFQGSDIRKLRLQHCMLGSKGKTRQWNRDSRGKKCGFKRVAREGSRGQGQREGNLKMGGSRCVQLLRQKPVRQVCLRQKERRLSKGKIQSSGLGLTPI